MISRTGDVLVEDVIFPDDIVDDLLRVVVKHKDLPLGLDSISSERGDIGQREGFSRRHE